MTAFTILWAGAASLMLGFALVGPSDAGAVPRQTSTTSGCGLVTCRTTPPTTPVPITSPPATHPPATAPPTTRAVSRQTFPVNTTPKTTVPAPTTTASTLPSIGGNLPVTPSTVPFTTKQQSSHVSPVFAALSGAGLFVALVIVAARFWLTRPPQ